MATLTRSAWILLLWAAACGSTQPRTQVMLIVDADPEVRALASELQVAIEGRTASGQPDGTPTTYSVQPMVDPIRWPYSLALVPRGDDAQRGYRVIATLSDATAPIAVLRGESGFVAHKTLALRLRFTGACLRAASLRCAEQESCARSSCVSAQIDPLSLPAFEASAPAQTEMGGASGGSPTGSLREAAIATGVGAGGAAAGGGSGGSAGTAAPRTEAGDCGDGRLGADEKCDPGIAAGAPGACPSQCPAADPCAPAQLQGSGCQTECASHPISTLDSGDGCCPVGADANSDADCSAHCGNSLIERGETCDPISSCPSAATCTAAQACLKAVVMGDAAQCNSVCHMQPIVDCVAGDGCCPAGCSHATDADCSPSCGDGMVNAAAGELCEPQSSAQSCPTACDDKNACTADYLTGSASNCNSACTIVPIVLPVGQDGCCPLGANANTDSDCAPTCGNNVVERGERCDGHCPKAAECDDGNACTRDAVAGTGCSVMCGHTAITQAASGDGCCPAGANANADKDCAPSCGNGAVESGELCDGNCPLSASACDDHDACTVDSVAGAGCNRMCEHTRSGPSGATKDGCCPDPKLSAAMDADCAGAMCGNGMKEPGEACDGSDCPACVDTDPCTREVSGGTPCNPTCMHQPIAEAVGGDKCCPKGADANSDADCKASCGNGVKEPGEDCDGAGCPACVDTDACTREVSGGTPCNPTCMHQPITSAAPGDGCCPTGADAVSDSDCKAVCGNGVTEPPEDCDGNCPACATNATCMRAVRGGTPCNPTCTYQAITSPAPGDACCPSGANANTDSDCQPSCGNGVVESPEECDGSAPAPDTCVNCRRIAPVEPPASAR